MGPVAQMVERVLSMHKVQGSMPESSKLIFAFVGNECLLVPKCLPESKSCVNGELAQMVERALSKHEIPGSMPESSTFIFVLFGHEYFLVSKRLGNVVVMKTGD